MHTGWFKTVGVFHAETVEIGRKEAAELMNRCELQVDSGNSDIGAGFVTYSNRDFPGVRLVLRTVWWR